MRKIKEKLPIAVVILTYNEELNIRACLESVAGWVREIIVVDSGSDDATVKIAKEYGAKVVVHEFVNQAQQFNWALESIPIASEWILRLDADEWATSQLQDELFALFASPIADDIAGFVMKRRVYFMGRWIKHGAYYPVWFLRLFRKGRGRSEERIMDEHIVVFDGRVERLNNDFVDDNKKDLSWWTAKHNGYATREAEEAYNSKFSISLPSVDHPKGDNFKLGDKEGRKEGKLDKATRRKRWVKNSFYYRLPLFWRALGYFVYRYFLRLGFLDGKEGLVFHFLHAFWYRFLIDGKLFEKEKSFSKRNFK